MKSNADRRGLAPYHHVVTERRWFIVAWIALSVLGAMNHTIAEKLLGSRFDLVLPHLKYGHVMFNKNLRVVHTYEYSGPDGVRHDLVDLVQTPAIGYRRSRLAISVILKRMYLNELCYRAFKSRKEPLRFYIHEYNIDVDPKKPANTTTLTCDLHGLGDR
jgi:hypothetical protein